MSDEYKDRLRKIRKEADRVLFSDGGRHWPIFRPREQLYADFWPFFERYLRAIQKLSPPSNIRSGKLNLPPYHPVHKNPIWYDDEVREIYDAHGNAKKDQVDIVRRGLEAFLHFLHSKSSTQLYSLREKQAELPMAGYRQTITDAVSQSRVTIIAADTGSGKSTQVPQYLLKSGFRKVAVTQPRRISSISLAKRVGYETLNLYGSEVAYKIRFEGTVTQRTRIVFLTEGLLLRQMQSDTKLSMYDVIILDEVHERHLQSDLLLGLIAEIIMTRDDLRLVLMSATINIDLFQQYFAGCPIIQVPGRLYPIQVQYRPPGNENQFSKENTSKRINPMPIIRILQLIDSKYKAKERGDVLVFLSGMNEIQTVLEVAQNYAEETKKWLILALHSTLSVQEQDKVFDLPPEGMRKCILSTNIAETSVTIDGIRFVVDTGKMKEMSFDPQSRMKKLKEYWISKASAEQRKGRSGRTGPGVCFRLYSEEDYDALKDYTAPEIQRVTLDGLILQMKQMKLGCPRTFNFIEKPPEANLERAYELLRMHSALDNNEELTPIGEALAQLPVDVVIGKMLIMATLFDLVEPVLTLAAALSVQSPMTRSAHSNEDALSRLKELESDLGDPFQLLFIFDEWIKLKTERQISTKKWCQRRGLEEQRLYEITNLRKQFRDILSSHKLLTNESAKQAQLDELDSRERKLRHGQLKMLRALKRKQQEETKKTKRLKPNEGTRIEAVLPDTDEIDEKEDNRIDISDFEFRMKHDITRLQDQSSSNLTQRDLRLLQLLACAGLYPQVAIADAANTYQPDQEQVFHTRDKNGLIIHPTSYFAAQPKALEPTGKEEPDPLQPTKTRLVSHRHQLLAYHSLLETSKPYVMMPVRVPALHASLLFSSEIDTSSSCQTIVTDRWIEYRLHQEGAGWELLEEILSIRKQIETTLINRLADWDASEPGELTKKIEKFASTPYKYSIRKLGPAERNNLYVGEGENCTLTDEFGDFAANAEPHPEKGGVKLAPYVTYNCLSLSESGMGDMFMSQLRTFWTCDICDMRLPLTFQEKTQHRQECEEKRREAENEQKAQLEKKIADGQVEHKKGSEQFVCDTCHQLFYFTTVQILKHRRSCQG